MTRIKLFSAADVLFKEEIEWNKIKFRLEMFLNWLLRLELHIEQLFLFSANQFYQLRNFRLISIRF